MRLFPHALIRIGGEPFDRLEGPLTPRAMAVINQGQGLRRDRETARSRLCEALFQAVQNAQEDQTRKRLIQLKRDIFNARTLSSSRSRWLCSYPDEAVHTAYQAFIQMGHDLERLHGEGEAAFGKDLGDVRRQLRELARMEALTKGLFLSSGELMEALSVYLATKPDRLGKKALKTELSLVKYLTRICAKTSPFSTFNSLVMVPLEFGGPGTTRPWLCPEREPIKRVSFVRLNNSIFQYLREILFRHPRYREHLALRPNPTLKRKDDVYLFLTNSNNVESFQRMPHNPVLELLLELVSARGEGIRFSQLVAAAGEHVDASAEELSDYVARLVAFGFLEFRLGISGTDTEWDRSLRQTLAGWDPQLPMIQELAAMLTDLRQIGESFGKAEPETRRQLLERAFELFRDVSLRWHASAGLPEEERLSDIAYQAFLKQRESLEKQESESNGEGSNGNKEEEAFEHRALTRFGFKANQLFYEDCALSGKWSINGEEIKPLIQRIDQLFEALELFDGFAVERQKMKHFFQNHFSEPVDLLTFYEAYYRDFKKPQAEREARSKEKENRGQAAVGEEQADRFAITELEDRRRLREEVQREFRRRVSPSRNATVVGFSLDHLHAALKAAGAPQTGAHGRLSSYAVFSQFYRQDGVLNLVLNGTLMGWGKYFSRFLHLFDEKVTRLLREWNQPGSESVLMLEAQDASVFNANLHPPLLPYEIWIPGGHNCLPPESQIPITDIQVSLDPREDELVLSSVRRGCPLQVLDLGFQSLAGRSELFKMLQFFNSVRIPMPGFLIEALNGPEVEKNSQQPKKEKPRQEEAGVRYQPRIVFEDRVVLRRRSWHFPRAALPKRTSSENDWSFFCRVHDWKKRHGIPDRVFAAITHHGELRQLEADHLRKLGRDDYKPQYLDFTNPLLVRLFEKLIGKTPRGITITEMLPAPEHLCRIRGRPYVTEATLQWYSGEAFS